MALVCNTQTQRNPAGLASVEEAGGEWSKVYFDNERYIESGSAYFAQAFAEALGLISDLELHDPRGAGLKLRSIAFLVKHALDEYEASAKFESWTGLNEYHERRLREAGLDVQGLREVLREAQSREFLRTDDNLLATVAAQYKEMGYSGLMTLYLGKVREIHELAMSRSETEELKEDAVAWQELGWKLTTLFARALEFGKAIAVLNTLTFRLPSGLVGSSTSGPS